MHSKVFLRAYVAVILEHYNTQKPFVHIDFMYLVYYVYNCMNTQYHVPQNNAQQSLLKYLYHSIEQKYRQLFNDKLRKLLSCHVYVHLQWVEFFVLL